MEFQPSDKSIDIDLAVGDLVVLLEDVDIDSENGFTGKIIFEDRVAQYVPRTRLLKFEESDVGLAKFQKLVEESDGIQIVSE